MLRYMLMSYLKRTTWFWIYDKIGIIQVKHINVRFIHITWYKFSDITPYYYSGFKITFAMPIRTVYIVSLFHAIFPRMHKSVQKIEMLKTCGGSNVFCSIIECSTLKLHTSKVQHISYEFYRGSWRPNGQGGNYTLCRLRGNKNYFNVYD